MEIALTPLPDRLGITIQANRIDASAALKFKDVVHTAVGQAEQTWVIIDLDNVDFVDSSGLGAIVSIKKYLGQNRRIDLCALNPAVEKVFRLTRMDSIFKIHPDLTAALNHAN